MPGGGRTDVERHPRSPDGSRRASAAVVEAVAETKGVRPEAIGQPLNDVVDPDALDALFATRRDGTPRSGGTVSFTLADVVVTVTDGPRVTVDPLLD